MLTRTFEQNNPTIENPSYQQQTHDREFTKDHEWTSSCPPSIDRKIEEDISRRFVLLVLGFFEIC